MSSRVIFLVFLTALGILSNFDPTLVHAAPTDTFTVNSTEDLVDKNLGDGYCKASNGKCTLRAAIMQASALHYDHTIILGGAFYPLNIMGMDEDASEKGDLDVWEDITIQGAGSLSTTIYGDIGYDRIFDVHRGTLKIVGVRIQGGGAGGVLYGGAVQIASGAQATLLKSELNYNTAEEGGAIYNNGKLVVQKTSFYKNDATFGVGGAIRNDGTALIVKSTFRENRTYDLGGAIANYNGTLTLKKSTLDNNAATLGGVMSGGGMSSNGGNITLIDSSLVNNHAESEGGGMYLEQGTVAKIQSSTLSNNAGDQWGGGLSVYKATVNLVNTTISSNAAGTYGGGIYSGVDSNVNLYNVTVADNGVALQIGVSQGGGIYVDNTGAVNMWNTILNGNVIYDFPDDIQSDCFGNVTSKDYNLISSAVGCGITGKTAHNKTDVDAQLGSLQKNGGPTKTHALLSGSPAIDAGNKKGCKQDAGSTLTQDQRHKPRPVDGNGDSKKRCDMGAYENQP